MVRRRKTRGCEIQYANRPELETAQDKLAFLGTTSFQDIKLSLVRPDAKFRWINHSPTHAAFERLIAIASKQTKSATKKGQIQAIFKMFSLGVITSRDESVYDDDKKRLAKKVKKFIAKYNERKDDAVKHLNEELSNETVFGDEIKWSRVLMARARAGNECKFTPKHIITADFRPFVKQYLYFDSALNEVQYQGGFKFEVQRG